MVAIAHPAPSRHRHPQPAARPNLRVIEGGRRDPGPATFLRRRIVAAVLVVAVLLALRLVAGAVVAEVLPGSTWAGAGATEAPAGSATYVVQPGDTLWTIADGLDRPGDIRATVDRLADLNGGAALDVGDRIVLPD